MIKWLIMKINLKNVNDIVKFYIEWFIIFCISLDNKYNANYELCLWQSSEKSRLI